MGTGSESCRKAGGEGNRALHHLCSGQQRTAGWAACALGAAPPRPAGPWGHPAERASPRVLASRGHGALWTTGCRGPRRPRDWVVAAPAEAGLRQTKPLKEAQDLQHDGPTHRAQKGLGRLGVMFTGRHFQGLRPEVGEMSQATDSPAGSALPPLPPPVPWRRPTYRGALLVLQCRLLLPQPVPQLVDTLVHDGHL